MNRMIQWLNNYGDVVLMVTGLALIVLAGWEMYGVFWTMITVVGVIFVLAAAVKWAKSKPS